MKFFCINNFVVHLIKNNFVLNENFVECNINEVFAKDCNVVIATHSSIGYMICR